MIYFMGASYYRYYNGGANIILIDGVIMLRIVWKMWAITIITVTLLAACSCQQQCNPSLCTCTANNCSNCLSTLFYSNSTTNQCQLCDYRCQTCASSAGCVLCAEGYYADGAGGCRECGVFCSQCASDQLCARCMVLLSCYVGWLCARGWSLPALRHPQCPGLLVRNDCLLLPAGLLEKWRQLLPLPIVLPVLYQFDQLPGLC